MLAPARDLNVHEQARRASMMVPCTKALRERDESKCERARFDAPGFEC